jgi:hypothetical protein
MLAGSLVMIFAARTMRVQVSPTRFQTPPAGIVLVFSGFALFGASLVLLLKSPFRMPPGERIFRLLWLGPIGRGFVRVSMRGVRPSGASARRLQAVPVVSVVRAPEVPKPPPAPADPLGALEARVAELERWRRSTKS